MQSNSKFQRFLVGLVLVLVLVIGGIAALLPVLHNWGASASELQRSYPGDEILDAPIILWTHAISIDAPVEQVWPWVAQMGDVRAAYYSYMFVENLIAGERVYINADRIVPEWQNPQPGDQMIGGALDVYQVEPGHYLLANSIMEVGWSWLWLVEPDPNGNTRLIVRTRIQMPEGMDISIAGSIIDAGGLVMARNMMQGIQVRAEAGSEPEWIEAVEIGLWLALLAAGLTAGFAFMRRGGWLTLGFGVLAIGLLLWFTFFQPFVWLRAIVDVAAWLAVTGKFNLKGIQTESKLISQRVSSKTA